MPNEKVVIVGLRTADQTSEFYEESMEELSLLVDSAGGKVCGRLDQSMEKPNIATFIGSGKLEQLENMVKETACHTVVFDDDLKPNQVRNIEAVLGDDIKVLDRSGLILDIFATRARTSEARVQVELAQLEYIRPRLAGLWSHLSRQYGGSIGARGPGETQLETDRRNIDKRISVLKSRLSKLENQRRMRRKSRGGIYRVALLGYTNAGKTTLLNTITHAGAHAEDKLFATLDPRTRSYADKYGRKVLFTDTVGFIRKLPHHLVESFRSTLAEAREADLLLVVADGSHQAVSDHLEVVYSELDRMKISLSPRIIVLNKIDLIDEFELNHLERHYPEAILTNARTGEGVDRILEKILDSVPVAGWASGLDPKDSS